MDLNLKNSDFLSSFQHVAEHSVGKNKLDLFILNLNSNDFDYATLKQRLVDPLIDFALSKKIKEKYKGQPGTLSRKAREKFIDYLNNTGELGELLLFAFLETHLKAPKILSKLELKTSTSKYVNGSDGVHFLRLNNGDFQLIFGESKTIKDLSVAISSALKSIYEFKNEINADGKKKSGLPYEKGLISDHLEKETFTLEEQDFLERIIFPKSGSATEGFVDDAFSIFIGFEIEITPLEKKMENRPFRQMVHKRVEDAVKSKLEYFEKKLNEFDLWGHNFYVFIVPFTNLSENRMAIQEYITK
jgi:hypothetical protein